MRGRLYTGLLIAIVLALPASAQAVTIGPTFFPPSIQNTGRGGLATLANYTAPGVQLTAPFDGIITRWRIQGKGTFTLRVIRQDSGTTFHGVRSGGTASSPTVFSLITTESHVPIAAGDQVGIEMTASNFISYAPQAGWQEIEWNTTPLTSPRAGTVNSTAGILYVNADVEPDADADGFGDETQDFCRNHAGVDHGCPPGVFDPPVVVAQVVRPAGLAEVGRAGVKLSKDRKKLTVPVSCPAGRTGQCKGKVSVRTGKLKLGSGRFNLAPGAAKDVVITIPAAARSQIEDQKKVPLTIELSESAKTKA